MKIKKPNGGGHNIRLRLGYTLRGILPLVAVLVITITVVAGGTYGWKYYSAEIDTTDSEQFRVATMGLTYVSSETNLMVFEPGRDAAKAQMKFEKELNEASDQNRFFADWLQAGGKDNLKEPSGKFGGGMVTTDYTFNNESNTAVYFRVKSSGVKNGTKSIDCPIAAFIEIDSSTQIMEYLNGYYYYTQPLNPEIEDITVEFTAYIDSGSGYGRYSVGTEYAEVIQADNNAVYISEAWFDLAALLKEMS